MNDIAACNSKLKDNELCPLRNKCERWFIHLRLLQKNQVGWYTMPPYDNGECELIIEK